MKTKLIILMVMIFHTYSYAAYLSNVPITITQPDETEIKCFATGDEFYNWAHDDNGYTIIQDEKTGYYCYALLKNDELIASDYIVGKIDIKTIVDIRPYVNISPEKIREKAIIFWENTPQKETLQQIQTVGISQTVNNIVVYIRFADQAEFPANQSTYTSMFNAVGTNANSMRNYFDEATYNQLDVISGFYPINNGTLIISYQDSHERNYFCPYSSTNPTGYATDAERTNREHTLLYDAIDYVRSQIPDSLDIDYNNDGRVDNICFIIRGGTTAWNTLLWPHRWSLYSKTIYINGKRVYDYNFQLENSLSSQATGVLCHEMNHTFGAPDLYHYNLDNMDPVGDWDLMEHNNNPPQHMSAYMKYKYGGWISSIPTIINSGTYILNPLTFSNNNCYRINIQGSTQFLVVEYRKKAGIFENTLPGSGLIIYRINNSYNGNSNGSGPGGVTDEVYVFRPDGTISSKGNSTNAYFSETSNRNTFSNSTNPYCFVASGDFGNLYIKNIRENSNNTLSFDVRFCDNDDILYSNTSNLPALTNASNSIQTSGTVIVKSTDNITFEAGESVFLNPGFEVQQGGIFEINMNGCGNK
jgi:M6 family metalloprotease-like protein